MLFTSNLFCHTVSPRPPSLSRSPPRYGSETKSSTESESDVRQLSTCIAHLNSNFSLSLSLSLSLSFSLSLFLTQTHTHTHIHTTQSGKSSGGSAKRRLQFKGKDILNIVARKRTASASSNDGSDKSPQQPSSQASPKFVSKVFQIPKLVKQSKEKSIDSRVKTERGEYSVAPRDVSVLERISHKAQSRADRVRKPHEVQLIACVLSLPM